MAIASLIVAVVAILIAAASATYTRKQATEQAKVTAIVGGGLERLDEVVISILDETGSDHWAHGLPHGVNQEQAEAFVWGPWEFNTGASSQVVSNRESRPRPYSRINGKNWDLLSLQVTRPGQWMTGISQEKWRKQYRDHPIRLLIISRREGYEPWVVQRDIKVDYPKVTRIRIIE